MATTAHHRVLIVGGGTAGISVAARLVGKVDDVAVIEPSEKHYYQPLWTLVGGGCANASTSERAESSVMPKKAQWIKDAVTSFDPDNNTVETAGGKTIGYDALIVCPGIQLDWDRIPGVTETLGVGGVSSNYRFDLAPQTWEFIRNTRSGTAVFTMPSGPIKCGGAPQKIAYLASDHWRKEGVLDDIDVHLVMPTPGMFGVPQYSAALDQVVADYGIQVHFESELAEVDPDSRTATFASMNEGGASFSLPYDVMHVVPHQSAPDWIKTSPLATDAPSGYVDVDKHTHQHVRYPNIFSLGDAGSTPNSKTGAAVRKQAPVVAENLVSYLAGRPLTAAYDGYGSCPLTVERGKVVLAEFGYGGKLMPTAPAWLNDGSVGGVLRTPFCLFVLRHKFK